MLLDLCKKENIKVDMNKCLANFYTGPDFVVFLGKPVCQQEEQIKHTY